MLHQNVELYNVQELLRGGKADVLSAETRDWLRDNAALEDKAWGTEDAAGVWLSRVPEALRRQVNPLAHLNALQAAGCELRFNLESPSARITLQNVVAPSVAEVYQGSFFAGWHMIGLAPTTLTVARPAKLAALERLTREHRLPFDARLTRVILPWRPPVRLLGLEGAFAPPRPEQTPAVKCLCYGSSITHGNMAIHPSGTYAARLAGYLGVDLINLGFGGGAHLEPEMAAYIAGRTDWAFATLELGINMLGGFTEQAFRARVEHFVTTLARAHPGQWLFCIDLFTCNADAEGNPKAAAFRAIVRETVAALSLARVVHLSGRELLTSFSGLTVDLLHPSPAGMEAIAAQLAGRVRRHLAPEGLLPREALGAVGGAGEP